MQREVDWRHWTGAAILVVALVLVGWQVLNRPGERPNAPAPAGANPRMQDAPDFPPAQPAAQPGMPGATAPGAAAPAPGLPSGLAR